MADTRFVYGYRHGVRSAGERGKIIDSYDNLESAQAHADRINANRRGELATVTRVVVQVEIPA